MSLRPVTVVLRGAPSAAAAREAAGSWRPFPPPALGRLRANRPGPGIPPGSVRRLPGLDASLAYRSGAAAMAWVIAVSQSTTVW